MLTSARVAEQKFLKQIKLLSFKIDHKRGFALYHYNKKLKKKKKKRQLK